MTTFTGRLGTPNSRYGQIVPGSLDGFSAGFDFRAHQLTSRKVRVLFGSPVGQGALDLSSYTFVAVSPLTAVVPPAESASYYDERHDSVVITFFYPLTTGQDYSVGVDGVQFESGETVLSASRNFTANVTDPPRAVGAFLSKRGAVDILFDKPVGPYSGSATFDIRDAAGGPGVAMAQVPWAGESLPETTLRVSLPPGTPTADAHVIDLTGVTDESMNQSSETVPLTLALRSPAPYSYADLVQLQITDAYVVDVSSDYLRTATVRVFFSGPVLDSGTTGNWTLTADGPHAREDTVNSVTLADAFDLTSLVNLTNDIKQAFNGHVTIEQVHPGPASADAVTTPDAVDFASAAALLNELQAKFLSHLSRSRAHLYQDTFHTFTYLDASGSLPLAIAVANLSLKASFNGHVLAEYPLSFSSAYASPVYQITSYDLEDVVDAAYDVEGPYTYFADLHVTLDTDVPAVNVLAALTSEDGGSTTSTLDYTGSIKARAASAPASLTSSLVRPDESVSLRFDREVSLVTGPAPRMTGPGGAEVRSSSSVEATLPYIVWAYNNAVEAYRYHTTFPGHQQLDYTNSVSFSDYAALPLPYMLSAVNGLAAKLTAHMESDTFHYFADMDVVTAPEATDVPSLLFLVADIRRVLGDHTQRVGPHYAPTVRILSAPLMNVIRASSDMMRDGEEHRLLVSAEDGYLFNGPYQLPVGAVRKSHRLDVDLAFTGLAVRPSVASAVPRSGLTVSGDVARFEQDSVEVFFSKPMRQVVLDSTNLPLSGGSVLQKAARWTSVDTAEIAVVQMEPIPYTLTAVGLSDEAGNTVY